MYSCIFLSLAILFGPVDQPDPLDAVRRHRTKHGSRILREFSEMLSIPNVATDTANINKNADHIRDALARRGIKAELLKLPGAPPAVLGKLTSPGAARTLGFYAHYDGQPVDRSQWTHPPWRPILCTAALDRGGRPRPFPEPAESIDPEWRLYARSSGDDKAAIMAMLAALDALADTRLSLTANLVFFFEGEEEVGSPHLKQYFDQHRSKLDVDAWIICDGPVHQSRRPQLAFGVRGITGLEITVYGATRYLHSGHYGNWAPNPAIMLAQLLAGMKNENGRVLIEGFYDTVEPLEPAQRRALATVPNIDNDMRRELGLSKTEAANAPYMERLLLPSLNIRGLLSGGVGATARNVIPTTATASLDIRLVKGNDPKAMLDLVEAHVRRQGFHIVRRDPDKPTRLAHPKIVKLIREKGYPAARTDLNSPIAGQIIRAAEEAAGQPIILLPSLGGSLPLYLFTEQLRRPAIIAPIANHDDNQHAPDENLRLANLWYGIDLMAALMTMPGGH